MQVKHPRDQRTSSSPGSEKRKSASTDGRQSLREKVARTVLQCQYCHHQARNVTGLARHTTGHTGARKCSQCNRGYAQGSSSSEHYLKLHEASCKGEQKWLAASADTDAPTPPLLRNEQEHQTLALTDVNTEYSDQPPELSVQVESVNIKPTPMVFKEENVEPTQMISKEEEDMKPTEMILKEEIKPAPIVLKEEEVSGRNNKFEAYISSQALNNSEELKPTVPLYIYNKPQQSLQPQQQPDNVLSETAPEIKKQERTQFGPKGLFHISFYC